MLKNISKLETVVGEKVFQFLCDSDSAVENVKEALFQFLKYAGQVEDQIKMMKEMAAKQAAEQPKAEDGNKQ